MIKSHTHILRVDDQRNLEQRILLIRDSLKDKKHEIYIMKNSIAVVVEEEEKEETDKEEADMQLLKQEDNIREYNDFLYSMRKLRRNI